jgi:hypothetical protein
MKYLVTARYTADGAPQSYHAIGERDALMDAAYDAGALGVSIMVQP